MSNIHNTYNLFVHVTYETVWTAWIIDIFRLILLEKKPRWNI